MGSFAPDKPSGVRRYNQFSALVGRLAKSYVAQDAVSPARLLGKLKRAAPYLGVPRAVLGLLDELVSHSKPQDWATGKVPIVWPRNETLALKLGVSVRQVQNYVRAAVEHALLVPVDSANGHRGGQRNAQGEILWAYGFDLRPLGTRAAEFDATAAKGAAEDREIDRLRRSLTSTRRRARMLTEAAKEAGFTEVDGEREMDFVRMAIAHVRGSRDVGQLVRCLAQVMQRVDGLQKTVDEAFGSITKAFDYHVDSSPTGEACCVHSTTTNQLKTAKAVTSNSLAKKSSEAWDIALLAPQSNVEADLDQHGVDPGFVAKACPELIWDLERGPRAWGRLVSIAEGLVGQHDIGPHAWREACRLMGQRGAAAAVIATVYKALGGEVRNPGAYLRGMSARAASGELHLGKTYHGLREAAAVPA